MVTSDELEKKVDLFRMYVDTHDSSTVLFVFLPNYIIAI